MAQTIYDLLTKVKVSEATVTQLNTMTGRTAIDRETVEFWSGVITVARAMGESRTAPHGLPIPETGTVLVSTLADGANTTVGPSSSSEVWLVMNLDMDSCAAAFKDGDGNMSLIAQANIETRLPFYLSSEMHLFLNNGSGSEQTPSIAYFKVSL